MEENGVNKTKFECMRAISWRNIFKRKNQNIVEEFNVNIEEQNLRSAVWLYMGYLSEKLGINEPSEVISITVDYLELDLFSFPDVFGFEEKCNDVIYDSHDLEIKNQNKKMRFAIWVYLDFCMYDLEINDFDEIANMTSDLINKFALEYEPMTEPFDDGFEN